MQALVEADAKVNKAMEDSTMPLYAAALNGREVVARALIEAGADVNKARDNSARRDTAVRIYDTRL